MSRLIRMSVLASGSTGNATLENEKGSLLVDVGFDWQENGRIV